MMRSVEFLGRSWSHHQFYGLIRCLLSAGYEIKFERMVAATIGTSGIYALESEGGICCTIDGENEFVGGGDSPWDAISKAISDGPVMSERDFLSYLDDLRKEIT